ARLRLLSDGRGRSGRRSGGRGRRGGCFRRLGGPLLGRFLGQQPLVDQERPGGIRRARALLQPGLDLFLVDVELDGVGHRVEGAKDLDELTVAWRARIGHHQSIERVFFRPDASQSNFYGQAKTSFNFSRAVRDRWPTPSCVAPPTPP